MAAMSPVQLYIGQWYKPNKNAQVEVDWKCAPNANPYLYPDGHLMAAEEWGGGGAKETWRRTVEREMKEQQWTWGFLEGVEADTPWWRSLVEAKHA